MHNKNKTAYVSTNICERKLFLENGFSSKKLKINAYKFDSVNNLILCLEKPNGQKYPYMLASTGVIRQFFNDFEHDGKDLAGKNIEVFFNNNDPIALSPIYKLRQRKKHFKPVSNPEKLRKVLEKIGYLTSIDPKSKGNSASDWSIEDFVDKDPFIDKDPWGNDAC